MKLTKRNRGQTMIEYIIIVVLIAISLLVVFSFLSKAAGRKVAGATAALDEQAGAEAAAAAEDIDASRVQKLQTDGTFN